MKFFVKNEAGELVEATQDEVLSPDSTLFNEEGEALNRHTTEKDPVDELTGVVADLAHNVSNLGQMKETQDEMVAKLAAFEEASKKGFFLPNPGAAPANDDDFKELLYPYDTAIQGKRLMDKIAHPGYHIEKEETRQAVADYFCLFLKASLMDDPLAKIEFRKRYGVQKTPIGDSGNVFPIPDIVESEILAFAREKSVLLQEARVWPMTSEKHSIPSESAGVTAGWGNTTSEDEPEAPEVELDAEELSVYSVVKNMTLADARSDIVSWITEVMAEACGQAIDTAGFSGTGSPCSGLFVATGVGSVDMVSGSTAFSSIYADALSEMIAGLDGLRKEGAKFYMHGSILHFVRTLKDTNDRPIFLETFGLPIPGTIWGYPYKEVIVCPSTSAVSTAFVLFGNLRHMAVGRRLETTALVVDPYGLFTTNRTRYKIYQRWGLVVGLPAAFVKLITAAS